MITRESGSTWTLRTTTGSTVTVTIDGQTQYGAPNAPAQKSQFTVGKTVIVSGEMNNGAVTAKRIRMGDATRPAPKHKSGTPTPSAS